VEMYCFSIQNVSWTKNATEQKQMAAIATL
jgi:hypothetical protein